jgi:hypothetical protein
MSTSDRLTRIRFVESLTAGAISLILALERAGLEPGLF